MKKLVITIVSTLLLVAAGPSLAQEGTGEPGKKAPRQHRGMQATPIADEVMRTLRRLDLSEEQKASTRTAMKTLKAQVQPLMLEMQAGHRQLQELIKAENYDVQAVAALAEKEGSLAAKRMVLTSEALSKIFASLTDEQRVQLDAMASERKQHARKHKPQPEES